MTRAPTSSALARTRQARLMVLWLQWRLCRLATGEDAQERDFAASLGLSPSQWSQHKAGKPLGPRLARQIEEASGQPAGWLDRPQEDTSAAAPLRELLETSPPDSLPATTQAASLFNNAGDATLVANVATRKTELLRDINQRNLGYFEQEVQKLDAWADDLKLGLEQEIKEIDREIKEVRRTAATSPTLEEKLSWQKKQRELEGKRSKLRRELFNRQDEVEAQRNDLISQLEVQLHQRVEERTLFTIEWGLT